MCQREPPPRRWPLQSQGFVREWKAHGRHSLQGFSLLGQGVEGDMPCVKLALSMGGGVASLQAKGEAPGHPCWAGPVRTCPRKGTSLLSL